MLWYAARLYGGMGPAHRSTNSFAGDPPPLFWTLCHRVLQLVRDRPKHEPLVSTLDVSFPNSRGGGVPSGTPLPPSIEKHKTLADLEVDRKVLKLGEARLPLSVHILSQLLHHSQSTTLQNGWPDLGAAQLFGMSLVHNIGFYNLRRVLAKHARHGPVWSTR